MRPLGNFKTKNLTIFLFISQTDKHSHKKHYNKLIWTIFSQLKSDKILLILNKIKMFSPVKKKGDQQLRDRNPQSNVEACEEH